MNNFLPLTSDKLMSVCMLVMLLAGCQTPFLTFPGGRLEGDVRHTDNFAFAGSHPLLILEVRPEQPYSVYLRVTVIEEDLYIDAAERRRWHNYIKQSPAVRVQVNGIIYPATAIAVTEPEITRQFLPDRIVYRIEPTSESGEAGIGPHTLEN